MDLINLDNFGDPKFDPKTWLNKSLKNVDNKAEVKHTTIEKHISKLQLYFQQLNQDIEKTSYSVMQNLPKVLYDMDNISEEAKTLKENLTTLKDEISQVETNSIMELEKIDQVKTQLVDGKQALYEADNWIMLSNEIEAIFETDDIDLIASKLVSMQQSLNVLSNAADYENKKMQLEGLKNRLEALASPFMVEAFSKCNLEQSKKYVTIFKDIDRLPQLFKYFLKCQKAVLIQNWSNMLEESEDSFQTILEKYYGTLLDGWHELLKFCSEIPDFKPDDLLSDLFVDLLSNLAPDISRFIENDLKENPEPLESLLNFKHTAENFLNSLNPKTNYFPIAKSVFVPLAPLISKYGKYQQQTFNVKLVDIIESEIPYGRKNREVCNAIRSGLKVCLELSRGACIPDFLVAADIFLNNYLETYKRLEPDGFQNCVTILQNLGEYYNEIKNIDQDCVQSILTSNNDLDKMDMFVYSEKKKEFLQLIDKVSQSGETSLFAIYTAIQVICKGIYHFNFKSIFAPISTLLDTIPNLEVWRSKSQIAADLPDYSFSPQEYITQVGQYLMNLPQLLEPFMSLDNPALNLALSLVSLDFIHLVEPHSESATFAEIFLSQITESACQQFAEQILNIDYLSPFGCRQLLMDVQYFGNVLEDLGFSLSEKLKKIVVLLKLEPTEFSSGSSGISAQLVAAVRQMRNIISD